MGRNIRDPHQMAAYYKVTINGIDVTSAVDINGCTLTDQEDMIRSLTFTLENAYFFSNKIARGQSVVFEAGSSDITNRRKMFKGFVKQTNYSFPANGSAKITIIAWGGAYRGGRQKLFFHYPHPKCDRSWARKSEIKASEIVKGILNESFYNMPVEVQIEQDHIFDYKNTFTQNGTDWMALRQLAALCGCTLAEIDNDKDGSYENKIIFVDTKKYGETRDNNEPPISFRYLERSPLGTSYENNQFNRGGTDEFFKSPNRNNNELIVDSIDFNQDTNLNSGSLRMVSTFDENTNTEKLYIQKMEDTNGEELIINYELKPHDEFRKLSNEVVDKFWNKLTFNWDEVRFEDIEQFFNKIDPNANTVPGYEKTTTGMTGAGALGFVGYTIAVEIIGDVYIEPYKYYAIYGIGKFSTLPSGKNKYYLRCIDHHFDSGGFKQTLNFYR